jgi:hypothetical protein
MMSKKSAKRFLERNSVKIIRRTFDKKFGFQLPNAFDQQTIKAKETLGVKRTLTELLFKKF